MESSILPNVCPPRLVMPLPFVPPGTAAATFPTRLPSVRTLLLWLVFACLLPVAIGAGALFYLGFQEGRAQLQDNTLQTARALVQSIDGQLAKAELLAQALATSESLARDDLAQFHQRARALLQESNFGQSVLLYDFHGQQRVNTLLPFGMALPKRLDPDQIARVFASGRPVVSDIFPSALTGRPVFSVAVPVFSGTKVVHALSIGIAPQQLNSILSQQRLPPQWVVTMLDKSGTIAARTRSPEKYVGKKGSPAFFKLLSATSEGSIEMSTIDGRTNL